MKNVVITGTSRGIGFELAKLFADKGHNVLAISRNTKPLKAINHPNIKLISVDISKIDDIKNVVDFGAATDVASTSAQPLRSAKVQLVRGNLELQRIAEGLCWSWELEPRAE